MALAYLYRQLDDACRRSKTDSSIGGPLLLLSVWSWDRFPVGRPILLTYNDWDDHGDPFRRPTWAYKWDVIKDNWSDTALLYKQYTNELDTLIPEQVEWQPYGSGDYFGVPFDYQLNPKCLAERHLWLMRCPLICLWAVELHLPHRVMQQFVLLQTHPPKEKDTDIQLHELDRKK